MAKFLTFFSWRNWGIIRYNSVWQNAAFFFYIALADARYSLSSIGKVFVFGMLGTVMTAYGYLVNDFADRELDRLHGKPNAFTNLRLAHALPIVGGFAVLYLMLSIPFMGEEGFLLLWGVWLLVATFYSLPPLRLKERGLIGLVATVTAQQALPAMMLFAAFGRLFSWGSLVLVLYAILRGTCSDVGHQMRDWSHDTSTGTHTFAVRRGYSVTQAIYAISLETERVALGAVMALMLFTLPPVTLPGVGWQVALAWPLALLYVPLYALTAGRSCRALRRGKLASVDPYDEGRQGQMHDPLQVIHHSLPSVLMPLYLSSWMTLYYWPNAVFPLILSLLYGLYSPRRWAATWPIRPLLAWLQTTKT